MAIINITPDSFSDGGRYEGLDAAMRHVDAMVAAGATIIDVGGESTRPGASRIEAAEQIERVMPVVHAIVAQHAVPVSIDTTRAAVAEAAKCDSRCIELAVIITKPPETMAVLLSVRTHSCRCRCA